jgi:cell division protein FtsN
LDALKRINAKFVLGVLFFLLAAAAFARGVNDPSVTVITPLENPQGRQITINWHDVQNPQQYQYILYRANRSDRSFIPLQMVSPMESRFLDDNLPLPLSNFFYFVTHENMSRLSNGVKITDEEIEAQLRTIPGYTGSSPGGVIVIQSDGAYPYGSYNNQPASKQPAVRPLNDGISFSLIMFANQIVSQSPMIPLDPVGRQEILHLLDESYMRRETVGTALYYAEHTALASLSKLVSANALPNNLESINMITFTDGLDTSSTDVSLKSPDTNNFAGSQSAAYRNFVSQQIKSRRVAGKKIDAWAIGVPGRDIMNATEFQTTLDAIASSRENVSYLNNVSQVESQLLNIADKIKVSTKRSHLTFNTPAYSVGTNVRLTFDNSRYADDSMQYIEGRVSYSNGDYSLIGLHGEGIIIGNGPVVTGKRSGAAVEYTITLDGEYGEGIMQWYKAANVGSYEWQQNSEFQQSKISDFTSTRKSAVVYLILDCSSSLNEIEINRVRQAAIMFIEKLYNLVGKFDDPNVAYQNDVRFPTRTMQTVPWQPEQWQQEQWTEPAPRVQQLPRQQLPRQQVPYVYVPPQYADDYSTMQTAPSPSYQYAPPPYYSNTRSTNTTTYTLEAMPVPNLRLPRKTVLRDAPYSGLWVQIGSFKELNFAQDLWRKLFMNGCNDAEIFSRPLNGVMYFRVKVGPYQDRSTVELARNILINSGLGFDDCYIVQQ